MSEGSAALNYQTDKLSVVTPSNISDNPISPLFLQENIILAYDTADDGEDAALDFSDSEQREEGSDVLTAEADEYPDVQIDWSAWISSMPSPVLID